MVHKVIFRMGRAVAWAICSIACLAAMVLSGCKGSDTDADIPVTVTVESSGIVSVADGSSIEVVFAVTPATTEFTFESGRYNAKLCYAATRNVPKEAYLESVRSLGGGRYAARITNRNTSETYFSIDVRIFITTNDGRTYMSGVFCLQNTEAVTGISSVSFLKEDNPQLSDDIYCTYDDADATFTVRTPEIVDVSALVATFIASGRVSVGGVEQQSGVTPNEITDEVTYVAERDGERHEF